MNFQRPIFFLAAFLFTLGAASQTKFEAKTSVSKNKVLIGEQFQLTLEIKQDSSQESAKLNIDSIPHFEILDKGTTEEAVSGKERITRRILTLTSFDSGHWVIPAYTINRKYRTDTIPIDVVFSDFNPANDYHDIKDNIEVAPEEKKKKWSYLLIIAAALVLVLVYLLSRRKKKPVVVRQQEIADPYREAMQQLQSLQRKNAPAKEYYSELVDIFRLYISRRKGISSLQKTTDDLTTQLKAVNMPKEQYTKLSEALMLSDFVKFAKYVPGAEDNHNVFETIKRSIEVIEQMK